MKVMVIEDELEVRELIRDVLTPDFDLVLLESGNRLHEDLATHQPDVVLLDQMLPGKSGAEVVKEIRGSDSFSRLPIIMVTGLSSEDDKVQALELGADDYVTKPFSPKELSARLRAVYRRVSEDRDQQNLVVGPLRIDLAAHRIHLNDQELNLTLTEFKILAELMKWSGRVLSRDQLRETALGNLNVTDRTIDVHMASLRKKLGPIQGWIETVRGVGYRFSKPLP